MNEGGDGGFDLSGDWAGVYNYPKGLPPVSFTARLSEQSGWLTGEMEEDGSIPRAPRRRRGATLQGRRVGFAVTWLKSYAERDVKHDVEYEGEISPDGGEISGRWSIFGDWSGTFLMVRQPSAAARRRRRAAAQI